MLKKFKESTFARLLSLMGSRLNSFIFFLTLNTVVNSVCFNIVISFISKDAFDAVGKRNPALLEKAVILGILSYVIGSSLSTIASFFTRKYVAETMADIRQSAFNVIQHIPIEEAEKHHSGEFISVTNFDMKNVEDFYSTQFSMLIFIIIHGTIAMFCILSLNVFLGLLVLFFGILTLLINNFFSPKLRKLNDSAQGQLKSVTSRLVDLVQSIPATKMLNAGDKIFTLFADENMKNYITSKKLSKTESSFDSVNFILSNSRALIVLCAALIMVFKSYITIGTVAAVMGLMENANFMFDNINNFFKDVQKSLSSGSNVLNLLNLNVESESSLNKVTCNFDSGILFKDVNFSYPSGNVKILKNTNLKFDKNTLTALLGHSGSGKSTIAKLLLKFYDITSGEIYVGGVPMKNIPADIIRSKISYIPQNPYLFYGTIEENIALGKKGASINEITKAAKKANADEFIEKLPSGYKTLIGEGESSLSGGQKQRIAIARALVKDAPIFLFDEATSALDSESENIINDTIKELAKCHTVIVITHKMAIAKSADKVYSF